MLDKDINMVFQGVEKTLLSTEKLNKQMEKYGHLLKGLKPNSKEFVDMSNKMEELERKIQELVYTSKELQDELKRVSENESKAASEAKELAKALNDVKKNGKDTNSMLKSINNNIKLDKLKEPVKELSIEFTKVLTEGFAAGEGIKETFESASNAVADAAFAFGPYGAAVGIALKALTPLVGKLFELTDTQQDVVNLTKEVNQTMIDEVSVADKLFGSLQDVNITEDDRSKLISEINSKYGEYLPKMLTEKSTADDIAESYNSVNKALRELAFERGQAAVAESIYTEQAAKTIDLNRRIIELTELMNASTSEAERAAIQNSINAISETLSKVNGQTVERINLINREADKQRELLGLETAIEKQNRTTFLAGEKRYKKTVDNLNAQKALLRSQFLAARGYANDAGKAVGEFFGTTVDATNNAEAEFEAYFNKLLSEAEKTTKGNDNYNVSLKESNNLLEDRLRLLEQSADLSKTVFERRRANAEKLINEAATEEEIDKALNDLKMAKIKLEEDLLKLKEKGNIENTKAVKDQQDLVNAQEKELELLKERQKVAQDMADAAKKGDVQNQTKLPRGTTFDIQGISEEFGVSQEEVSRRVTEFLAQINKLKFTSDYTKIDQSFFETLLGGVIVQSLDDAKGFMDDETLEKFISDLISENVGEFNVTAIPNLVQDPAKIAKANKELSKLNEQVEEQSKKLRQQREYLEDLKDAQTEVAGVRDIEKEIGEIDKQYRDLEELKNEVVIKAAQRQAEIASIQTEDAELKKIADDKLKSLRDYLDYISTQFQEKIDEESKKLKADPDVIRLAKLLGLSVDELILDEGGLGVKFLDDYDLKDYSKEVQNLYSAVSDRIATQDDIMYKERQKAISEATANFVAELNKLLPEQYRKEVEELANAFKKASLEFDDLKEGLTGTVSFQGVEFEKGALEKFRELNEELQGGVSKKRRREIESEQDIIRQMLFNSLKRRQQAEYDLVTKQTSDLVAEIRERGVGEEQVIEETKNAYEAAELKKIELKQKFVEEAKKLEEELKPKGDNAPKKLDNEELLTFFDSLTTVAFDSIGSFRDYFISQLQVVIEDLSEKMSNLEAESDRINSKINELEDDLEGKRSGRREAILQALEAEKQKEEEVAEAKMKLENEIAKQQEKLDKQERLRQRDQLIADLAQAITNTALGITKALALDGPLGILTSIPIGLAGAVQTGIISAQLAKFAEGGFTGNGEGLRDETGFKQAGVVHEGEWVAPKWMVNNPQYGQIINSLENTRQKGFANGGFTSPDFVNMPNLNNDNSMLRQMDMMIKSNMQMANRPIYVDVTDINNLNNSMYRRVKSTRIGG